jgi:CBS domain-containing protein
MLVGAIMSRKPITVDRDHTVLHVARVMKEQNVGAVVVVDERKRPIGICTDRDVTLKVFAKQGGNPGATPVDRIMTRPVFTVDEDVLLFDLLRLMAKKRIRRVPVVDSKTKAMIGMAAMDDIILLLTTELTNVAEVLGHSSRVLGDQSSEE